MQTKVKGDDAALGKTLTAKPKKVKDVEVFLCACTAQMTVDRRQLERLAGLPQGFADCFYNEQGAPFADVSMLFISRELQASGKFWRGDEEHEAVLQISKAMATDLRFKLEANGAVMSCKLEWRAAGDEIEMSERLLGQWVCVDMTFRELQRRLFDDDAPKGEPKENGSADSTVVPLPLKPRGDDHPTPEA